MNIDPSSKYHSGHRSVLESDPTQQENKNCGPMTEKGAARMQNVS